MQGVWVFASAAARDAAVTSPQEGNFAYLKDTNVTTYYTGSARANLDTTGMTNPMTTTGDTIYSSSGSTPARLGIGSTGQVLTVAAGVPSWATAAGGGGMTLLSTTNLTGATVTISTINQTYNNLYVLIENVYPTVDTYVNMTANSDTTSSNYQASLIGLRNGAMAFRPDNINLHAYGIDNTNKTNLIVLNLFNYAGSTYKCWSSYASIYGDSTSPFFVNSFGNTIWYDSTAISSLTFTVTGASFSGGTVKIYGVK
jgi:hypothetical protein